MTQETNDELLHIGVARRSGRYPWGSGKDPQRNADFLSQVDYYRHEKGLNEKQIVAKLGLKSTGELRSKIQLANVQRKVLLFEQIKSGKDRGESDKEIASRLNVAESTVRNYSKEDPTTVNRARQTQNLAEAIKKGVDKTGYLDVGAGVEVQLGVTKEKLRGVVQQLKEEGYEQHIIHVPQVTNPNQKTTYKVLAKDKTITDVFQNVDKIRPIDFYTNDGGTTMEQLKPFKSIDFNKVHIRYKEDGGVDKDGVMELRPGVADLNMGNAHYAQVRIAVGPNGGTHYLKGMAVYGDAKDFPAGTDVIFNTNKSKGTPKEKVLKEMKPDKDNPFGASIKRQADVATEANLKLPEKDRKKGAVNIVNEEGDWKDWSKTLSAQMLSKQPIAAVRERLDATLKKTMDDYDEIMKVENPVVRGKLLEGYASDLESKQVHLKAQAPAKTLGHVILPVPNMSEKEVYAPRYKDGDNVILIRYPHGGTFEIPELTVNNRGPGKKIIGADAPDAIGIHPKVAGKLSGADFDGDTVYVIPNNNKRFKSKNALKELENFDPNDYADDPKTFKQITPDYKQKQMGIVSNLITDMTLHGASDAELARAVRHSMVVIDSEKHKLNYKRSETDNQIAALQKKYQTHIEKVDYEKIGSVDKNQLARQEKAKQGITSRGASTLISRHKETTEVAQKNTKEESYIDKYGKIKTVLKNTKTAYVTNLVEDASALSSGSPIEGEYVKYVNALKTKHNAVLKDIELNNKNMPKRNPAAALAYKEEVASLDAKVKKAQLNAPRERQAQLLAQKNYNDRVIARGNENLDKDQLKKMKQQSLAQARIATKAERNPVHITENEWEAIQANAISATRLKELIRNMDDTDLKKLATPRDSHAVSPALETRIKAMLDKGLTLAQVAEATGKSVSTITDVKAGAITHSTVHPRSGYLGTNTYEEEVD